MLDKSIPYVDILMIRREGTPIKPYGLPSGYELVSYQAGDEDDWAQIVTSVGEFDHSDDAYAYFQKEYLPHRGELERRCLFIQTDESKKVATLTVWWEYTGMRRDPWIHWVAVKPPFQGLGLGKAMVASGLERSLAVEGDRDIYLHTQTWSYKAFNIYRDAGFEITREKGLGGYVNDDLDKALQLLEGYLRKTMDSPKGVPKTRTP